MWSFWRLWCGAERARRSNQRPSPRQPHGTIEIVNTTKGTTVGSAIGVAATIRSRMVGLLGEARLDPGEGLLIVPSSGVHTWGMRFPIDVVALNRHLRVLDV